MSKKTWMHLAYSLALGVSLAFMASLRGSVATAQNVPVSTGEWTASVEKQGSGINLNFGQTSETERTGERGNRNQFGQTYELAELGLTREQVMKGGPVAFTLAREAGTISCEGSFQNGKGSGTFRFTRNASFVAAMKSKGFDFEAESARKHYGLSEDKVFAAAALNVTTALADDLLSAGFGKLGVDDLFKAAIFKIDSAFMREMKATGFPNMDMEDLVKARIFKIDAEFVRQTTQMGFGKEPFESLVKMRIFKVTPEFLAEVRNEGLKDLSVEDSVKLRIFNIDAEFIRKAKAEGVPLNVERLVQRRIGVGGPRAI